MEIYYAIMNILDYYAKRHKALTPDTIRILNSLASINGDEIPDIADANDCGNCKTWTGIVRKLSKQFDSGMRF